MLLDPYIWRRHSDEMYSERKQKENTSCTSSVRGPVTNAANRNRLTFVLFFVVFNLFLYHFPLNCILKVLSLLICKIEIYMYTKCKTREK